MKLHNSDKETIWWSSTTRKVKFFMSPIGGICIEYHHLWKQLWIRHCKVPWGFNKHDKHEQRQKNTVKNIQKLEMVQMRVVNRSKQPKPNIKIRIVIKLMDFLSTLLKLTILHRKKNTNFLIPYARNTFYKIFFPREGIRIWKSLSTECINVEWLDSFKQQIKSIQQRSLWAQHGTKIHTLKQIN